MPPDLPVVLKTALVRRIGDFLGLARRAGQAVAGFEKARDWMRTHPAGLILQAADGSETERSRFRSAVPGTTPVFAPLTGAELGRVFGHDHVVHVAVAPGRLASAMIVDAGRLDGLTSRDETRTAPTGMKTAGEKAAGEKPVVVKAAGVKAAGVKTPGVTSADTKQAPHRAAERATAETNGVTGTNG